MSLFRLFPVFLVELVVTMATSTVWGIDGHANALRDTVLLTKGLE